MQDLPPVTGTWGALSAALVAIVGGVIWARKMLASTSADVAGDRAEVNIIDILQTENKELRDRLNASEAERIEQWRQIADMSAQLKIIQNQVQTLTETNQRLTTEVHSLRSSLEARS